MNGDRDQNKQAELPATGPGLGAKVFRWFALIIMLLILFGILRELFYLATLE